MKKIIFGFISAILVLGILVISACSSSNASTPKRPVFNVAWSIYVGWMPWPYAQESGILKKWADKYDITINLQQFDYVPSIEAYVSGKADGVAVTNMDILNMASSAGIDSTSVIIGDYSNGNDKVITRNIPSISGLKGKDIYIVEGSVSQYLLSRAIEIAGTGKIIEKDVNLSNVSDSDIGSAFISNKTQQAVVTWNPIALEILNQDTNSKSIFDSSMIPNEILDLLVLKTDVVKNNPNLVKALSGAWYETIALMQSKDNKAITSMAQKSGSTVDLFNKQVETTHMYWTAKDATDLANSGKLVNVMDLVRKFSFDHGLFGEGNKSVDSIGISFPDGTILGDKNNVNLRFQ